MPWFSNSSGPGISDWGPLLNLKGNRAIPRIVLLWGIEGLFNVPTPNSAVLGGLGVEEASAGLPMPAPPGLQCYCWKAFKKPSESWQLQRGL